MASVWDDGRAERHTTLASDRPKTTDLFAGWAGESEEASVREAVLIQNQNSVRRPKTLS
jgi:hypothetical protein